MDITALIFLCLFEFGASSSSSSIIK